MSCAAQRQRRERDQKSCEMKSLLSRKPGRGEGARDFPPAAATRRSSRARIHSMPSCAAESHEVFIVYARGLAQPEEDRLAPHFAVAERPRANRGVALSPSM